METVNHIQIAQEDKCTQMEDKDQGHHQAYHKDHQVEVVGVHMFPLRLSPFKDRGEDHHLDLVGCLEALELVGLYLGDRLGPLIRNRTGLGLGMVGLGQGRAVYRIELDWARYLIKGAVVNDNDLTA